MFGCVQLAPPHITIATPAAPHVQPGLEDCDRLPQEGGSSRSQRPLDPQRSSDTRGPKRRKQRRLDGFVKPQIPMDAATLHWSRLIQQKRCDAPSGSSNCFPLDLRGSHPPADPPVLSVPQFGGRHCDTNVESIPRERALSVPFRYKSRRTRARHAAARAILDRIVDPTSTPLNPPSLPYPPDILLPDTGPFPRPPNFRSRSAILAALDAIDVAPLDLEELSVMCPSLRSVLAPIRDVEAFRSLFLPGMTIPRHAPSSNVTQGDWAEDLVRWGVADVVRKWDAKAMMKGFAVPKSDGSSARFILDASPLNEAMQRPPHFRLASLAEMRPIMFSASVGQITDLRHCFYQYPVDADIALYFCLRSSRKVLSMRRMAMGWSWAPSIAQATALAYLEPCGPHSLVIYDDFVTLGSTVEECAQRTNLLRSRMVRCNGTIHPIKSAPSPTSRFTFSGIQWDLPTKCHRLDPKMVEKWAPCLSIIALGRPLPLRIYWIAMGIATYIQRSLLLPPASLNKLFSWAGQLASQLSHELLTWNSVVTPWAAACNEFQVIRGFLTRNKWIQYHVSPRASPTLYTDSSLTGWAWLLHELRQGSVIFGMRGGWHPGPHINVLELLTVRFAMQ